MNEQRLMLIADWLDAGARHPNIQFDMRHTIELRAENDRVIEEPSEHWVRSPRHCHACIAGVAAMTYSPIETTLAFSVNTDRKSIFNIARKALDLTHTEALQLFVPYVGLPYEKITPKMAAAAIRSFVATGVINGITWADAVSAEHGKNEYKYETLHAEHNDATW